MDLFRQPIDQPKNLLPQDGIAHYYGILIPLIEADHYLQKLLDHITWQHDHVTLYGKHITTKRKVAWYGDKPYRYTYSNSTKRALAWNNELLTLKTMVEQKVKNRFNSCLLNLYHNGSEAMSWHSDSEQELKKDGYIASLSFGAERKFSFRHKQHKTNISLILEHGSLLVMQGSTQTHWQHSLPAMKKVEESRINLTFRQVLDR